MSYPEPLRDQDLRRLAHSRGVRPGDEMWSVLRELQRRRDTARAQARRRQGYGNGRNSATRGRAT